MNPLSIFNLRARLHRDNVTETHSQVVPDNSVHENLLVRAVSIGENDANGLLTTLALEQDCVAAEELQLVHLRLGQGDDRVVIVVGLVHQESVGLVLLTEDRRRQVIRTESHRVKNEGKKTKRKAQFRDLLTRGG